MFIDGSYLENKACCGIVVPFWNCRPSLELHSRKARRQTKGKAQRLWKVEGGEREERALAMASQIHMHCTMSSYPLFFCGNENMYNMLHAPVYGRTGSFGVSKRRATCPSLHPRKFLLRYRAAGKWSCAAVRSLLCFSFRGG